MVGSSFGVAVGCTAAMVAAGVVVGDVAAGSWPQPATSRANMTTGRGRTAVRKVLRYIGYLLVGISYFGLSLNTVSPVYHAPA